MAALHDGGYPVNPPLYHPRDYRTPPQTPPAAAGGYSYYSPRQYTYANTTSARGHARRATTLGGDGYTQTFTTTGTTPRKPSATHYASPHYAAHHHSASFAAPPPQQQPKPDYVSNSDRKRERTRLYDRVPNADDGTGGRGFSYYTNSRPGKTYHASWTYVVDDEENLRHPHRDYHDRYEEYLPRYVPYESPRPPPYSRHQSYYSHHEPRADRRYYDQVPLYSAASPAADPSANRSSRPRRASEYASKPTPQPHAHAQYQQPPPPRTTAHPRPTTSRKTPTKATEEDARRHGIPAGYSYKNWDPSEEPILLLGSVFDANSLGKWIYDWTVFYYGPATPISEIAGELWLLLIALAQKVQRAEDAVPHIRATASRELVDEFLESGERLWQRFNKLLKICENYMWRAAQKECAGARNVTMGKNSGCEFVDSIFGRHRELERTEKLMTGMRLWSMRFDANCEEILRNPSA